MGIAYDIGTPEEFREWCREETNGKVDVGPYEVSACILEGASVEVSYGEDTVRLRGDPVSSDIAPIDECKIRDEQPQIIRCEVGERDEFEEGFASVVFNVQDYDQGI